MALTAEEKERFLKALEEDKEFRYAVAGYLGVLEVLKRLDALGERMVKLERAMVKLWREQVKLRKEVVALRSGVNALKKDTGAIRTTLERLTLTIEEEARSVVRHRVRERLNVDVELDRIFVDSMEVNIYGAAGDLCVVGEATVRLGPTLVSELLSKIEAIKRSRPDLLRRKDRQGDLRGLRYPRSPGSREKSQSVGAKVGQGPYAARRRRELVDPSASRGELEQPPPRSACHRVRACPQARERGHSGQRGEER
jgi:hypothetical protein